MKNVLTMLLIILTAGFISFSGCSNKDDNMIQKPNDTLAIGQSYQGGIIFYIDNSGEHGFIAAPGDQSNGIKWSNGTDTPRTKAASSAVGMGKANTDSIVSLLGVGNYAASICQQLALNRYDDWFLPSVGELQLLYTQKAKVGGFTDDYYWSSTDLLGTPCRYAGNIDFTNGRYIMNLLSTKSFNNKVRAIRAF
jgi:hypothetical protein